MSTSDTLAPVSHEFSMLDLGDVRRRVRAQRLAENLARHPSGSLPQQASNSAELEGSYRWFNNPDVAPEAVMAGHVARTVERAKRAQSVLVAHDTTTFNFGGLSPRVGAGPIGAKGGDLGFLAHYSVCFDRHGKPLGTMGLQAWARDGKRKPSRARRISQSDPDSEALRWQEGVHATGELLAEVPDVVHVMDREGDCLELLADMCEHGHRFVVRVAHDRRLDPDRKATDVPMLYEALAKAPVFLHRNVPLSRRGASKRPAEPVAFGRLATRDAWLTVRAETHEISPGNGSSYHLPEAMRLNFIEVIELDPPTGLDPVHWRLVTTEPIETPEQVAAAVDIYVGRWPIEEFFKSIKTGCNFEKLQLETVPALILALTIYTAVAWRLLLLRWLDRNEPEAPAATVLTPTQLRALVAVFARQKKPLPNKPTVHHVFLAIASLGGHITNNGPPGWLVLRRGFDQLLAIEIGFLAAMPELSSGSDGDVIND